MSALKKRIGGFTLVELLVVVGILALILVLVAIVTPTQVKKGRDAKRKADLEKIKAALYDYYFDAGCFPQNIPNCGENLIAGSQVYLGNFPCDSNGDSYGYEVSGASCSQWFKILANLEMDHDPDIDKVNCRKGCGPACDYNYGLSSTNIRIDMDCVPLFGCGPSGDCIQFDDPYRSRCPVIFYDDGTCQSACGPKAFRCHDESGKHIP